MSLREKLAKEIAFAGRCQHDVSRDAQDFWDHSGEDWRGSFLRQANAILSTIAESVPPLEWTDYPDYCDLAIAQSPLFTRFKVELGARGKFVAVWSVPGYCDTFVEGPFHNMDEAKAAVRKEYERRILKAAGIEV